MYSVINFGYLLLLVSAAVLVNGRTADAIDTYQQGIFVVLDGTLTMPWGQKAYNTRFDIVINEYAQPFL